MNLKTLLLILILSIASINANAYLSTFDTAESLGKDKYRFGAEAQYLYNGFQGANANVHFDWGLNDEETIKFQLGSGSLNIQAGVFYKWSPVPDTDHQPAIGGFFGMVYATKDGRAMTSLRLHPIISKKFKYDDDKSYVTPFISIPFGVTFGSGSTTGPVQFTIGADWRPIFFREQWSLTAELGSELSQAFSYASFGMNYFF